jgi:hypothetical protein
MLFIGVFRGRHDLGLLFQLVREKVTSRGSDEGNRRMAASGPIAA